MTEQETDAQGADDDADENRQHRNVAVGAFAGGGLSMPECTQRDAETAGDDAHGFQNPEDTGRGDCADAHVADVAAKDLHRGHVGDGDLGGINGHVGQVAADHPDQRHEHEIREDAASAEDHGTAQAHHVSEAEDETDGVEADRDLGAIGERAHDRDELKIQVLLPHVERRRQEVVNAGDGRRLEQQPGLGTALFARHQDLGNGRRFGVRQAAVHLAHEIAAQRDQKRNAQRASGETDEDGLDGMRVELQDVERRQREDRAGDDGAREAADARDDDVFQDAGAARIEPRQTDRQDRNGDRRLHHLPDLQARISRGDREDDA